jgi:MFS family permease
MGTVGAINFGADFLMATIAGAFADRSDRKRIMFIADLGRAVLTAVIPISVLLGGPTMALILVVSAPLAILRGFFRAGYLAAMPDLVGRSQLARGNGILETASSASFILGPSIAGFLVTVIGPGETLAVDAASFALSSAGLFLIRRDLKAPPDRPASRMVDDIREGIVFVARHPILRTMILLFATGSASLAPIGAVMTFRVVRDLGESPAAFGLTLTGLGVGTLVGSLFATRLGHATNVARIMVGAMFLMGLPIIGMGLVPSLPAIVLLSAVSGAGEAILIIVYISVRAASSPDELLGRIASTARVITLSLAPIGSLVGGLLIDTVGATPTLAVIGTTICAVAVAFSRAPGLRAASLAPGGSRAAAEPLSTIAEGIER